MKPGNATGNPGSASRAETREVRGAGSEAARRLGAYVLDVKVGEGGMGKVFRCRDPQLDRLVAVKVLHDKYGSEPRYTARFLREARAIASVRHPSVAQVYGVDDSDGRLAIVMEYVEGPSLDQILERQGPLEPERARRFILAAARGLGAASERGIVHRDVKPSNLLVDPPLGAETGEHEERLKIVDFGLAKELGADASITDEGIVLGTPQYLSPEQGRGEPVDHRSDIYSLGATFYHLVTGRPPFEKPSQIATIVAHVRETPPRPDELASAVPAAYSAVIGRMMAVDPGERYATYAELIEDLEALGDQRSPPHARSARGRFGTPLAADRPRRGLVAGVLGALVLAAVITAFAVARPAPSADLSYLGGWYRTPPGSRPYLALAFDDPPADAGAVLDRLFLTPPSAGTGSPTGEAALAPHLQRGALRWQSDPSPIAISHVFESIDTIAIEVVEQHRRFDFGLAILHPDGGFLRSLRIVIRPLSPLSPHDSRVTAARSGDDVSVSSENETATIIASAPYEARVSFAVDGDSTRIRLAIHSGGGERQESEYVVAGTDWASGVVCLRTVSPTAPFGIAIRRIEITGAIGAREIREVPWRD